MKNDQILQKTERSRVKRNHERGHFDRETIYAILDASPLCHVGYLVDGKPIVTPTLQWRDGSHVYWHGSSASRAIRRSAKTQVCLTVSILDGYVMARSAFHHSANYRAAMVFGEATAVTDADEKVTQFKVFVDKLFPGRWETLRPINKQEVKATGLLRLPIEEASAKIRTGGPVDDEEDYDLPIWAGTIPVTQQIQSPIEDTCNLTGVSQPDHIKAFLDRNKV